MFRKSSHHRPHSYVALASIKNPAPAERANALGVDRSDSSGARSRFEAARAGQREPRGIRATLHAIGRGTASSLRARMALLLAMGLAFCAVFCSNASAQATFVDVQLGITGPWSSANTGPVGVASDSAGNIYVGEHRTHDVIRIDAITHATTTLLTTVCGTALGRIQFMLMDSSNNLYITDLDNQEIFVYSIPNATCVASYPATDPFGIALDSAGNLYYTENTSGSSAIWKIPAGSASGSAGAVIISGLNNLSGIAFDPTTGNMLVADQTSGDIYQYSLSSGFSAGSQYAYITGLSSPYGVEFDNSKNLLLALGGTNDVVKYFYPNYQSTPPVQMTPFVGGAEGIGSDPSGDVFLTAYTGNTVTELGAGFNQVPVGTTSSAVGVNFQITAGQE